jgi:hypothetical protein
MHMQVIDDTDATPLTRLVRAVAQLDHGIDGWMLVTTNAGGGSFGLHVFGDVPGHIEIAEALSDLADAEDLCD